MRSHEICHTSPISGICALSSQQVVTVGYDNRVVWWDHQKRRGLAVRCHDHLVNDCAVSSDGSFLATASADHTVRIWRNSDQLLLRCLADHTDDVDRVIFSPCGDYLATTSHDKSIWIYSTATWEKIQHVTGHGDTVYGFQWLPSQGCFVTSSNDGEVRFWDGLGTAKKKAVNLGNSDLDALDVVGGKILVGNDLGEIICVRADGQVLNRYQAHGSGIKKLCSSQNGKKFATAGYDGVVKIWTIPSDSRLKCVGEIFAPANAWLRSMVWIGDSEIGVGSFDSCYLTLDVPSMTWLDNGGQKTLGLNCAVVRDNGIVVAGGDAGLLFENEVQIFDAGSPITAVQEIDKRLLVGNLEGTLFLQDESGTFESVATFRSPVNCISKPTSDQCTVLIGTYNGELARLVYSSEANDIVDCTKIADAAIKDIAVFDDSCLVLCSNGAGAQIQLGAEIYLSEFQVAHSQIANAAASLGMGKFVSVGRDKRLTFWKDGLVAESIETPLRRSIKAVASSSGGKKIVCGSYLGEIGIYCPSDSRWSVYQPTSKAISSINFCTLREDFLITSFGGELFWLGEFE